MVESHVGNQFFCPLAQRPTPFVVQSLDCFAHFDDQPPERNAEIPTSKRLHELALQLQYSRPKTFSVKISSPVICFFQTSCGKQKMVFVICKNEMGILLPGASYPIPPQTP
jgi:hypothetical protein